ncbi:hypothetical protein V2J09_004835 [Rumex salicifolius]
MEEEEGGMRLSKRFSDKGGEVDYKTTSGTAWSHNFLNQKPWHPLSYPNQRRKWIAEQQHAQHQRRSEEVSREYAQEQEFFRQAALVSQKEKEKMEMMQAVSFMYVRPPGYNAESAKAAELAAEDKKIEQKNASEGTSSSMPPLQEGPVLKEEKKKARAKDVFGRSLPTEEEFEVLKNAPKMDTGVHGRVKPFAKEIRNVKCVRCGNFGHQSGDRECPLKDAIMPSEENRLKRDDPLTAILAHTDAAEPVKWELKQKPGLSPPRGGFDPDDPNQQIVAEDIYDEYGGFLGGGDMPELLAGLSSLKPKKKSKRRNKHKKQPSYLSSDDDVDERTRRKKLKFKKKKEEPSSSPSEDSGSERHNKKSKRKYYSSDDQEHANHRKHSCSRHRNQRHGYSPATSLEEIEPDKRQKGRNKKKSYSSIDEDSDLDHHKSSTSRHRNGRRHGDSSPLPYNDGGKKSSRRKEKKNPYSSSDEDLDHDPKKHSTSGRSKAINQVDRWSPSPYNDSHQRSSNRKEINHYTSEDHRKKHTTPRHTNDRQQADRSRSSYVDDMNSRKKQSKKSYSSDEQASDHDHQKHLPSRHRDAMDRSTSPYDGSRSSRKEKRHSKRNKLKNDDSEFDSSDSSEYNRYHDISSYKQSHQHRSQHHRRD